MKKISLLFLSITLFALSSCSSEDNQTASNEFSKLYINVGDERIVEINLENGNESLIKNLQNTDILDQIIFLNNEFVGVKENNGITEIKKINLLSGNVSTVTSINNYVNIIK